MTFKQELKNLERIISIAQFGKNANRDGPPLPYRQFGLGPTAVLIEGFEEVQIFEKETEYLFKSNKAIYDGYSFETFESEIISIIRNLSLENKNPTIENLKSLFDKLLGNDLKEFEVFNEIFGVTISSSKISLGKFTVYNYSLSRHELTEKYIGLYNDLFTAHIKGNYLIGIAISAREQKKAVEKANAYFSTFENTANYIINDLDHRNQVTIFGFKNRSYYSSIVCTTESVGKSSKAVNILSDVDLEDKVFTDPLQGNDHIWDLITKKDKSELERRILNAVEWIGKATIENEMPKSLVQFVFAVEGLLQYNEGQFITPSIVSQLSDWLAFIISDDPSERKKIAASFKELYRKRSAIAHGSKILISKEDLYLAANITKHMIISLLTYQPLKRLINIKQLNDYMDELKYK